MGQGEAGGFLVGRRCGRRAVGRVGVPDPAEAHPGQHRRAQDHAAGAEFEQAPRPPAEHRLRPLHPQLRRVEQTAALQGGEGRLGDAQRARAGPVQADPGQRQLRTELQPPRAPAGPGRSPAAPAPAVAARPRPRPCPFRMSPRHLGRRLKTHRPAALGLPTRPIWRILWVAGATSDTHRAYPALAGPARRVAPRLPRPPRDSGSRSTAPRPSSPSACSPGASRSIAAVGGSTGVVGTLRNGRGNRAVGLRADMDALPMEEENDFAHRSTAAGRMHACGHDGHTTMLLGAARYLAETRRFDGTVHFIFQPAEEGGGGARAMVADGLFRRFPCDAVYGLHNRPGMAVGRFGIRPGAMMAGCAFFDIRIHGKGGHAARPETHGGPGGLRRADRVGAAKRGGAQRRLGGGGGGQRHRLRRGQGLQRHPGAGGAARHGARLPHRNDAPGRGADAGAGREHRRRLRRHGGARFPRGDDPGARTRPSRRRSSPTPPPRWWARTVSSATGRR